MMGKKKVLVVGAGAAGTAAAYSLGKNPDKFDVQIWERSKVPGGVACTADISKHRGTFVNYGVQGGVACTADISKHHGTFVNYGVQGGTPTDRKTMYLINESSLFQQNPGGVACTADISKHRGTFVNYGVQGGTPTYRNTMNLINEHGFTTSPVHMMISFGKDKTAWTNYNDSELTKKLRKDIARFEGTLKFINKLEAVFIFLPISKVLKWFGYSEEFMYEMVFPLTALFFGTGNQTPNVSAAIVARVFLDDDLRLFDYDTERLLSQTPEMFAFPNLEQMYEGIITKSGAVFHRNRPVKKVVRTGGKVHVTDMEGEMETFDAIVYACDAETALKTLGDPSFMEQQVLGNVRYFNDLIVTHDDEEYMNEHYELHKEIDQYLVRTDKQDPSKIEMSFDLSNYQRQLKAIRDENQHVFQTIYLDDQCMDKWTYKKLKPEKVMLEHWWRQFSHTWRHFAFTVPVMRYIQGRQNTYYCGSYTLVNTHEVAVMSGLAAAYRLGAPYPYDHDKLAKKQFDHYLMVIHGRPRKFGPNLDTLKAGFLAFFMLIFAVFSLTTRMLVDWWTNDSKPAKGYGKAVYNGLEGWKDL